MQPHETKAGPGGGAPEPRCNAEQANAVHEYPQSRHNGNRNAPGADRVDSTPAAWQGRSGLERLVGASEGKRSPCGTGNAYRDSEGRIWRYRGKRARVLDMLATMPEGVTQWDTYPWHTRLGGTIHAMREDGLVISTELEGPYRHARYRLATRLVGDDTPDDDLTGRFENNQSNQNGGGHVG